MINSVIYYVKQLSLCQLSLRKNCRNVRVIAVCAVFSAMLAADCSTFTNCIHIILYLPTFIETGEGNVDHVVSRVIFLFTFFKLLNDIGA